MFATCLLLVVVLEPAFQPKVGYSFANVLAYFLVIDYKSHRMQYKIITIIQLLSDILLDYSGMLSVCKANLHDYCRAWAPGQTDRQVFTCHSK